MRCALRESLYGEPFYRLIHAEADGMPGLVIDRYGDVVVVQLNSAGMDRLTDDLLAALDTVIAPRVVVLRNDSSVRELEGLTREVRVAKGEMSGPIEVRENGARFPGRPVRRPEDRLVLRPAREPRLHGRPAPRTAACSTSTATPAASACQAAVAGAAAVTACDRSEPALALARQAAQLNGVVDRMTFVRAEAFAEMERLVGQGERFGMVICDPPAFVKSQKDLQTGARGYRKLAKLGAALVEPGGYLFIASCSHNMPVDRFAEEVAHGLGQARRSGRILRSAGAAPDHPVHPMLPESAYLKCQVLQLD